MTLALLLVLGQVSLADEGGAKKVVNHLNCVGAGISCTSSSTFGTITVAGGGGGAPTTVPYWTGAADATLSAEHNLGALGTGLVVNTAGTPSAYAGSTCGVGTFATATNASGALTCSTPTNYLHFITIDLDYTDIAVAASSLQKEVANEVIPAKARVTRVVANVTQGFDDGAGPTTGGAMQCGPTSGTSTFLVNGSIATVTVRGDINSEQGTAVESIPGWSSATDLWCTFTTSGGNLNLFTTGALTFYIEYVLYP